MVCSCLYAFSAHSVFWPCSSSVPFSITHGSGRAAKIPGNTYHGMTSGGCKLNIGGVVPDYKYVYVCNKPESKFCLQITHNLVNVLPGKGAL